MTVTGLKMSVGVKDSTGTFTYPLCPMQGVIAKVLLCVGGADSVRAELMPTSMDGDEGAEGVCERMGGDDGEGVSECMGGEDGAEGVCESMGGDDGAERVCERAFLCFTFFWLFLFTPGFAPTAESLSVFHRNSVPTFIKH